MFSYSFIQNAFIVGISLSIVCALLGVFVVQKKMSYLGSGLSHSAIGGVGLAIFIGVEPLVIAIPFTLLISIIITLINEKTTLENDTAIGVISSVSIAMGMIFVSLRSGYNVDMYSYLFGSILAVHDADITLSVIFLVLTIIFLLLFWSKLAFAAFDRELATAAGINVKILNFTLSIVLAFVIVLSAKLMGIILVGAFLVLPPAISKMWTNRLSNMTILAVTIAVLTTSIGIYISLLTDFPTGATIILVQALFFLISICKRLFN